MSGVPRSQALIVWAPAGRATSPTWTCPSGYTTLVKSGMFHTGESTPGVVLMILYTHTPEIAVTVLYQTLEQNVVFEWKPWFVMHPGWDLVISYTGTQIQALVSGAVLAGPPQFPAASLLLPAQEPHG